MTIQVNWQSMSINDPNWKTIKVGFRRGQRMTDRHTDGRTMLVQSLSWVKTSTQISKWFNCSPECIFVIFVVLLLVVEVLVHVPGVLLPLPLHDLVAPPRGLIATENLPNSTPVSSWDSWPGLLLQLSHVDGTLTITKIFRQTKIFRHVFPQFAVTK